MRLFAIWGDDYDDPPRYLGAVTASGKREALALAQAHPTTASATRIGAVECGAGNVFDGPARVLGNLG